MTTDTTTGTAITPSEAQEVVRAYLATWNATEEQEQMRLLAQHWSPKATYVDPLAAVEGHDELRTVLAGVHQQFPDFVFSLVGDIDSHHDQVRFQWGLGPLGAEPVVIGFDVMVLDEDGRIVDVRGFLDRIPQ
ncbi:nuclear transport factor 2 family protein [Nocardioides sp. SR21]|uniref:nuclear transport factor 2 family protein n=1 Tax=Nocardioides sp. SR21 TaxID=2919501 RepID=UPI001FA9C91F|nr:nuclear transport factor 2 family protein [Nocardioides sp. SR21]